MKNLFIRHKINKCISILQASEHRALTESEQQLIISTEYSQVLSILEDDGCISITRAWNADHPVSITLTKKGFSGYLLNRHDVWMNRLWGFLSGVAVGILTSLLVHVII